MSELVGNWKDIFLMRKCYGDDLFIKEDKINAAFD